MDIQYYIDSFAGTVKDYVPGVLGALLVLLVGWLIARWVRSLTYKLLHRTGIDDRITASLSRSGATTSRIRSEASIAKLVYWVLMVIVFLIVLEMLGVSQVLDPLKNMANEFLSFIPNIVAALVIGFVGYVIAKVASELSAGLVAGAGGILGNLSQRMVVSRNLGVNELGHDPANSTAPITERDVRNFDLAGIVKTLVFIFVFIPVLVAALDALHIRSISEPAKEMLSTFINAIPKIFAAVVIIAVFYFGGRFVTQLLTNLLRSLGVDNFSHRLGMQNVMGNRSLSSLIGSVAFFFLMFMGIISGLEKLDFVQLTSVLRDLLGLAGNIFYGLVILVAGNWLSNLAAQAIASGQNSKFLSTVVRFAIMGLFLAIGLQRMFAGEAINGSSIIELAFGLSLGAIAVAVALSFGLGGREAAGREMERILNKLRERN